MAVLFALSLYAAPFAAPVAEPVPAGRARTAVSVVTQASVRIVSGARIALDGSPQPEGYEPVTREIVVEDGSRRPAQLIEFE